MKLKSFLLLAALFIHQISFAQAPTKQWDVDLGGTKNNELHVRKHTSDGGYILGGFSKSQANVNKSQASRLFSWTIYWWTH